MLGVIDSWNVKRHLGVAAVALVMSGVVLCVVGFLGLFLGRLIRAAVARQREYLADASAVQWTRNPQGLGQALRKILAQSAAPDCDKLRHPGAELVGHLFIHAPAHRWTDAWLATHPPLAERIRRVYGRVMGPLATAPTRGPDATPVTVDQPPLAVPMSYAWIRDWQQHLTSPESCAEAITSMVHSQSVEHRMAKLGLALPVLRQWPVQRRREWMGRLREQVHADAHLSAGEFVALTLLQHHLDPSAHHRGFSGRKTLEDLAPDIAALTHWVAQAAQPMSNRSTPWDFQVLERCLGKLHALAPLQRPILLRRLGQALGHGCTDEGSEVLRALAILLDCPMPVRSVLTTHAAQGTALERAPALAL